MAEFVRFLGPGEHEFIPLLEMDADNQRSIYEALGEHLFRLWELEALPNEAVGLVRVDDMRSVAVPFVTTLENSAEA